jgi:general secretion pathway protein L
MATKVIGLDFGSRSVKLCESSATLRTTELVGFDFELLDLTPDQRPSMEMLADAAHSLLNRRGLLSETILCTPPSFMVSFVELEFPFASTKKVDAVLAFELDDRIPLDVEDIVFDYRITDQSDSHTCCLVAFAKRSELGSFLEALLAVGIDPKEVGFGPLLLGAMPALDQETEPKEPVMIIDLGHHTTHIAVISESGMDFARDIPIGCSGLPLSLSKSFELNDADAFKVMVEEGTLAQPGASEREIAVHQACTYGLAPLLRELKRTWISLANREVGLPSKILLVGGGSLITGIAPTVEASLRRPVVLYTPFEHRAGDNSEQSKLRLFAKAAALTNLKGSAKFGGRINLRQNEFAYTGDFSQIRGRLITTSFGIILCLILLAMLGIAKKRVLEAKHAQLQREVATISKSVLGVETNEVSELTQALEEDFEADFSAIPPRSVTELLHDISTQLAQSLTIDIDRIEINLERKSLVLRGKAPRPSDVEDLTEALEKMKCFRDVQQERVEAAGEESTRFRLSATANCQEGGS